MTRKILKSILIIIGLCMSSCAAASHRVYISSAQARDLGMPIPTDNAILVESSGFVEFKAGAEIDGLCNVYTTDGKLWYSVRFDKGAPLGPLIECYDSGAVKMVAIYEVPGNSKAQYFFYPNGMLMKGE